MNLLPKTKEQFGQKDYWDTFFKKRGTKAFEWYGEYPELCSDLHKYVKSNNTILIVGCGNSTLGNDLYDVGCKNITSVDISHVVIKQMIGLNEKTRPEMKFLQMDATKMTFDNGFYDIVIDKGTLDALMPDEELATIEKINNYFSEIERVLKFGGKYICVSLLQGHIVNKLLEFFHKSGWLVKIIRCYEAENKAAENDETVFPVFMIVCSKINAKSSTVADIFLEFSTGGLKAEKPENVKTLISNIQQSSFLCSHLQKTTIKDDDIITFDICRNNDPSPRYTVYLVDGPMERKNAKYAAFIVPQGREAEWLFSTLEGRVQLAKLSHHNRLLVITMHRNQSYGNIDDVKSELNDIVKKLAPADCPPMIPYLSMDTQVGERVLKYQGNSNYSGDYVIEDVTISNDTKYRRLYYLQTQMVIQSEARLKSVKSRRGKVKDVVDPMYLTCKHHLYMTVSSQFACGDRNSNIAVIGLGGGGLCTFLRRLLPKTNIKIVDIDEDMLKIATEWFGFQQDDKAQVEIMDGLEFLENSAKDGVKYDAVLFDVDSKDTTIGMSCPPKQFLDDAVINNVIASLNDKGVFILNCVIRDSNLREPIVEMLGKKFANITTYKLKEDLNEVMICLKEETAKDELLKKLTTACNQVNKFLKSNGLPKDEFVDIKDFLGQ